MPWSTETKMNVGWIDPGLLRDFQAEGTDAYRLCTIEDGWVERFGSDVLLSFKMVLARERLLEELQTWADWADVHVRRVFARFIPRESERREPPALVVGDPGESLQTVATEWSLRFGLDFGTGYSPGLFLDQRENRRYVRHIAPRRLLNCFAYTCSFSVTREFRPEQPVNGRSSVYHGRRAIRAAAPRPERRKIRCDHPRPPDFFTLSGRKKVSGATRFREFAH